jgi:MFS family permease
VISTARLVGFDSAPTSIPGSRPSPSAASRLSDTSLNGPAWISTCAITLSRTNRVIYVSTAVLSSAIGVAVAPWQAGVFRGAAWTVRSLRMPARNALLADVVSPDADGRAYGFERAMDNLGAIAGPLLAIALIAVVSIRTAIFISVIPGLLSAVAIVYAIRHTATPKQRHHEPIGIRVRPLLRGPLGRLMIGITAFEIGNCATTLLILHASQLFAAGRDPNDATQLALFPYIGCNIAAAAVSVPAGWHGDRHNPVRVLIAGAVLFVAGYAWFAAGAHQPLLLPAFILTGLGIGCGETAEGAAVASLVPGASAARPSDWSPPSSPPGT